jgi:hypothetical protein
MRVQWDDVRDCFVWDGGRWIDLYAFEVSPDHWNEMFRALDAAGYGLKISEEVPDDISELFGRRDPVRHLAYIKIDRDISLSVFYSDSETIEITIDPCEILGPEDFAMLCGAVETISSAIAIPMVMCPENLPGAAFLCYAPDIGRWTFLPWPREVH